MNKRWLAGVTSSQFDICSAYVLSTLATGKVSSMNVKQKANTKNEKKQVRSKFFER